MGVMSYILVAFFLPFIFIGFSIPVTVYIAQQRNREFGRTHVQVEALSDARRMEVYVCDKPIDGSIGIYEKRTKDDTGKGKKERKLLGTLLAMYPHPSSYPFKMWKGVQADITGYYANAKTGSFVPLNLGVTDPLEVASQLGSLANEKTTQVVVRESREMAKSDDNTKKMLEGMKSLPMLLMVNIIATIIIGVLMYILVKGVTGSQSTIINGLRGMGVIP